MLSPCCSPRLAAAYAVFLGCMACAGEGQPGGSGQCGLLGKSSQRIFHGAEHSNYVQLAPGEETSIGLLVTSETFCTFVLIGRNVALTAGHCLKNATPIRADLELGGKVMSYEVSDVRSHETLDVAAFTLSGPVLPGLMPLALWDDGLEWPEQGARGEVAGVGINERGTAGPRRFLVATVLASTKDTLDVSADGRGGACTGDSGGALLARSPYDGSVRLLGILSRGAVNCKGTDEFIRVSAARGLVTDAEIAGPNFECGRITSYGSCFLGASVWCDNGRLRAEQCTGGRACAWSEGEDGYRCILNPTSSCGDIDEWGTCSLLGAERCEAGSLLTQTCSSCERCVLSATTGTAACDRL